MKVGDMVERKLGGWNAARTAKKVGLIIDLIEKKCWRTHSKGVVVDWGTIDPEPHAVVLYPGQSTIAIPLTDLEVVDDT